MQVEDDISQLILENKKNTKGNRTGKLRRWSHCPNVIIFFVYRRGSFIFQLSMLKIDLEFTKCSCKNSEKHMRDTFAAASLWSFNLTFNMQKISTVILAICSYCTSSTKEQ